MKTKPRSARGGAMLFKVGLAITVLAVAGSGIYYFQFSDRAGGAGQSAGGGVGELRWRVQQGDLTISALSTGELRTKDTTEVFNAVSSYRQMKITWIIPEGTEVKVGDKLIELDASEIEERYLQQKTQLTDALNRVETSESELKIAELRFETDLMTSENRVEIAAIELRKYKEGEYLLQQHKAEGEVAIAEEALTRAESDLVWSVKLARKKYVTQQDLDTDRFVVKQKTIALAAAREDLKLLEKFTYDQQIMVRKTDLVEAEGLLKEVELTAERDIRSKEAKLSMSKEKAELEKIQTDNLKEQLDNAILRAPTDGLVVFHKERSRYGSQDSVLQIGSVVHPRQRLIDLPDFSAWVVEARVHESLIQKIRLGQAAFITLDAIADELLEGKITYISVLPDSQNWMRETQEYIVSIELVQNLRPFKPGMTGKVEIIIDELKDILSVPIQAVSVRDGKPVVYVAGEFGPEMREVEVGLNNDRFIEIVSGLVAGQEVIMDKGSIIDTGLGARPSERATVEQRAGAGESAREAKEAVDAGERGDFPGGGGEYGPGGRRQRGERGGRGERGDGRGERRGTGGPDGSGRGGQGQWGDGRPGGMDPSAMTPEQQQQMMQRMQERMKQMSPEQRSQMEERMKQFMPSGPPSGPPNGPPSGGPTAPHGEIPGDGGQTGAGGGSGG